MWEGARRGPKRGPYGGSPAPAGAIDASICCAGTSCAASAASAGTVSESVEARTHSRQSIRLPQCIPKTDLPTMLCIGKRVHLAAIGWIEPPAGIAVAVQEPCTKARQGWRSMRKQLQQLQLFLEQPFDWHQSHLRACLVRMRPCGTHRQRRKQRHWGMHTGHRSHICRRRQCTCPWCHCIRCDSPCDRRPINKSLDSVQQRCHAQWHSIPARAHPQWFRFVCRFTHTKTPPGLPQLVSAAQHQKQRGLLRVHQGGIAPQRTVPCSHPVQSQSWPSPGHMVVESAFVHVS